MSHPKRSWFEVNGEQVTYLDELDGGGWSTLADLEKMLPALKAKYGAKARIGFDAGYNNVSVVVIPSKKLKD